MNTNRHERRIRTEQQEAKITAITGHVFVGKGKLMTEGWKTAFNAACRWAGLKGLWFHDLRYTFVTRKVREEGTTSASWPSLAINLCRVPAVQQPERRRY